MRGESNRVVEFFPWFLQYEIRIHSTNKIGGLFKVSKVGVVVLWADCMACLADQFMG